eukprot:scaffold66410_cov26-Attheya_sp.AAC.1
MVGWIGAFCGGGGGGTGNVVPGFGQGRQLGHIVISNTVWIILQLLPLGGRPQGCRCRGRGGQSLWPDTTEKDIASPITRMVGCIFQGPRG